ncbi:MAG: hypothetical protein AB8G15_02325 [Saprospiraceae bacterium]
MKNLVVLFFIFFYSIQTQAQGDHSIYIELGGAALSYSLNYDMRFEKKDASFGARIGVGRMDDIILIPLHLNYLHGAGKHRLELGLGVTTLLGNQPDTDRKGIYPIASGTLMYRYQNTAEHLIFRVGFSPTFVPSTPDSFIDISKLLWVWPGISAGYIL